MGDKDLIKHTSYRGIPVEILTGATAMRGCWEQVIAPELAAARASAIVLRESADQPGQYEYAMPTPGDQNDGGHVLHDLCKKHLDTLLKNSEQSHGKEMWGNYVRNNGNDAAKMMLGILEQNMKTPRPIDFDGLLRLLEFDFYNGKFYKSNGTARHHSFVFFQNGRKLVEKENYRQCFRINFLIERWVNDWACQKISIPGQIPRYFIDFAEELFPNKNSRSRDYIERTINRLRERKFGKYKLVVDSVVEPSKYRHRPPPPITLWSIDPREFRELKKYYEGKARAAPAHVQAPER